MKTVSSLSVIVSCSVLMCSRDSHHLLVIGRRRRVHLSTGRPYRAGPKAGEVGLEDTLKLGWSRDYS